VEKHLAAVSDPDEAVTLPKQERHDATGTWCAAEFRRSRHPALVSRCRESGTAAPVVAHVVTSEVPTVADASGRRRTRRCSARP
jgi:hypothetical protein